MSLLGVLGSVAGGLLGRSKGKSASSQSYGNVKGLVQASRAWGINLLTWLGGGVSGGSGIAADNSALGQGIANAAMLASDALASKRSTAAALNAYQQQNRRLQDRLNAVTLRAPVPGVYGTARMPSDPEVYGGADFSGDAAGVSGARGFDSVGPAGGPPLRTVSPADPRRDVNNKPQDTHSGLMVIDSPYVGEVYVPTLDGDEALDVLDVPSMAMVAPQIAYNRGAYLSYGGGAESRPNDKFWIDYYKGKAKSPRPKRKPPFITLKAPTTYGAEWVR
jgi:hypothetical protein